MQSTYSWCGSPIHLVIEDEIADAYNRAVDAYFAAQKEHKEVHGTQWNPLTEPLLIRWNDREQEIWNKISDIINSLVELNDGGLSITEEQMTSDYLVKL